MPTLPPRSALGQLLALGAVGALVGWAARVVTQPDFDARLAPAASVGGEELRALRQAANQGGEAAPERAARVASRAAAPLKTVTFDQVMMELLGKDGVYFVDARDEATWAQGHIPGARNVDAERAEADEQLVERALGDVPKRAVVVVYCSGGQCDLSRRLGEILRKRGWRHVLLYEGGWAEWQREGAPVERAGGDADGP